MTAQGPPGPTEGALVAVTTPVVDAAVLRWRKLASPAWTDLLDAPVVNTPVPVLLPR